jgi:hypothetical protein
MAHGNHGFQKELTEKIIFFLILCIRCAFRVIHEQYFDVKDQ